MVKGLMPKRVKRNVGMNPIARAVARENLRRAILDQKIQLYVTAEGAECLGMCVPIQQVLTALVMAADMDEKVGTDNREVKLMRGAISACEQMIANNSYRRINITSLEQALDCAVELNARVKPELFNKAWNMLTGGAG